MSQPSQSLGATPAAGEPAPSGWPAPEDGWPAPAAPTPAWQQPAAVSVGPPASPPVPDRRRWGAAAAALAGLAAGAIGATVLAGAVVVGSAERIGRSIGEEVAPALREGVRDGMVEGSRDSVDAMLGGVLGQEGMGGWTGGTGEDVERFPPVAPGELGPDAELDAYAGSCFAGDLQACDDLLYRSPPLSEYEEYAGTCGGRVKEFSVPVCTELE